MTKPAQDVCFQRGAVGELDDNLSVANANLSTKKNTRAVAATQFTAYMAMMNLVISYSATWQGHAIELWGYPTTLVLDGLAGLVCLACLPFLVKPPANG